MLPPFSELKEIGSKLEVYDMIYICQLQLGSHPLAVVEYTFTHKQHIEQHKYKQYTEKHK